MILELLHFVNVKTRWIVATPFPLFFLYYCDFTLYHAFVVLWFYSFWLNFGMSVLLHRYFSHNAFRTNNRFTTFIFGFIAQLTNQNGFLWWASKHNRHHKYCDTENDPHSPIYNSFLYAFIGWTYYETDTELKYISREFKNIELLILNEFECIPYLFAYGLYCCFGYNSLFYYYLPSVIARYTSLLFGILAHVKHNERGGCQAIDLHTNNFFMIIGGETLHKQHHLHPTQIKRHEYDLPYDILIVPMLKLSIIYTFD
jgi:fatty-acid desaturase